MRILAIETSCDETGAAVVEKGNDQLIRVLSNITATSSDLHARTGGVIPEFAAREQIKAIIPTTVTALLMSSKIEPSGHEIDSITARKILEEKIDAIAVTHGPGLIGSLLVGVETAKTLSFSFNKPLIPVNHLLAHLSANFIDKNPADIKFPIIGLIVSGGHTDLLLFQSLNEFKWLGGTRDDAAGEALDKIGRVLNLPYPAGPEIERRASKIKPQENTIKFKSPLINSEDFDFSFSGLKAECSRFIAKQNLTERLNNEICYALQNAIFDVLIKKSVRAIKMYNAESFFLGGGVSANLTLREKIDYQVKENCPHVKVYSPDLKFTTDNAAMIGVRALINYEIFDWKSVTAQPELYFE